MFKKCLLWGIAPFSTNELLWNMYKCENERVKTISRQGCTGNVSKQTSVRCTRRLGYFYPRVHGIRQAGSKDKIIYM